ncbi:MAG: gamma-glutamyl-gamma-aminobutyrate hydrolase family protein [Chromatiales bacterium]|nr:gamma-glutamyl-gamma-aminobutyrate hydrolase family protein [Chromatiales bacterium]
MALHKPVIGVPACRRMLDPHYFHIAGEKYLTAIANASGCIPVIIPALGAAMELEVLLDRLDGLLIPGSPSMVDPQHYDGEPSEPGTLHDPHRDETTLTVIPTAVAAGVPVMAICRGYQEMNVAFGGSLHQKVHKTDLYDTHHEDPEQPLESQYGPAHEVRLAQDAILREVTGKDSLTVNSLHHQGVDRLGRGLAVEAIAHDGLIEAFRVADAPTFALGVQWHPEWKVMGNEDSIALFTRFGDAARAYAKGKRHA